VVVVAEEVVVVVVAAEEVVVVAAAAVVQVEAAHRFVLGSLLSRLVWLVWMRIVPRLGIAHNRQCPLVVPPTFYRPIFPRALTQLSLLRGSLLWEIE
jgi:hypothetical protein